LHVFNLSLINSASLLFSPDTQQSKSAKDEKQLGISHGRRRIIAVEHESAVEKRVIHSTITNYGTQAQVMFLLNTRQRSSKDSVSASGGGEANRHLISA
jgi:hypothetical protein